MYESVIQHLLATLISEIVFQVECEEAKQTVLLCIAGKCVTGAWHNTVSSYKAELPDLSMHMTGPQYLYCGLF